MRAGWSRVSTTPDAEPPSCMVADDAVADPSPPVTAPTDERILGIIGGAGVGAAARLYADVAAHFRASAGHLPRIALWNAPFSDALEHAFVGGAAGGEEVQAAEDLVAEAVERLLAVGVTAIAMPCNSLHGAAADACALRGAPFVDMIAATLDATRDRGYDSALLFATAATYAAGLYEGHGIQIVIPSAEIRAQLGAVIVSVVEAPHPDAPDALLALIEAARLPGTAVVLGCTDICGLLSPEVATAANVIESLGALAGRCVATLTARATDS
jgi:aspartate racemase